MTARVLGLCLALCALRAGAQGLPVPTETDLAGNPTEGKPDIRYERVAGEVVAGTYAGVLGYFAGRGVGTVVTMMMNADQERVRDRIVDVTGWIGSGFAIGGTVYAIGNIGAETGSFPETMKGVAAGAVVSLALSHLVFSGRMRTDRGSARRKWWVATLECSLPAIGGTIAFNSSRRWQR